MARRPLSPESGTGAIRLYHRWKCPWCAAARQGIENVGVVAELVEVPYPREERHEVLALTGQSRVPVLMDGDELIVDSRRIVRHLYERYGGARFAPSAAELAREDAADPEGIDEYESCPVGPPQPGAAPRPDSARGEGSSVSGPAPSGPTRTGPGPGC